MCVIQASKLSLRDSDNYKYKKIKDVFFKSSQKGGKKLKTSQRLNVILDTIMYHKLMLEMRIIMDFHRETKAFKQ